MGSIRAFGPFSICLDSLISGSRKYWRAQIKNIFGPPMFQTDRRLCMPRTIRQYYYWLHLINITILYWFSESVRRNPRTSGSTDRDIELAVSSWLKYSRDREGGRSDRASQQITPSSKSRKPPTPGSASASLRKQLMQSQGSTSSDSDKD
jgi:hypothetical protein